MPKISVIVPVYNVRDHLEKCVRSVTAQTLDDWELLLVDDGSADGSGALCRALAGDDPRIRVLERPNGGVGAARNDGLDAASGEYIAFLDGDDAYMPDHLRTLLTLAEDNAVPVSAVGAVTVDESGIERDPIRPEPGVFHDGDVLKQFLCRGGDLYACWNKLFRRDVIGCIRFSSHTRAEDALFCARVLARADGYAVSDAVSYRYFRRSDSVTVRSPVKGLADQLLAWDEIYGLVEKHAPELRFFVAARITHNADTVCRPLLDSTPEDRALVRAMREKYYPLQFAAAGLSAKNRAAAALYRLSPELFYRIAGR